MLKNVFKGFLMLATVAAGSSVIADSWIQVGPGGGGRFRLPEVSCDGNKAMIATDMGSYFHGEIGEGKSKFTIGSRHTNGGYYKGGFFYHPTRPELVFSGSSSTFSISTDGGKNWTVLAGEWDTNGSRFVGPSLVVFSPYKPDLGYAWFENHRSKLPPMLFKSDDAGKTWMKQSFMPENKGFLQSIFFKQDGSSLWGFEKAIMNMVYGTNELVVVKELTGADKLKALSGTEKELYAPVNVNRQGYVLVSDDAGKSWNKKVLGKGYSFSYFKAAADKPGKAYFVHSVPGGATKDDVKGRTVYKTEDGFNTWKPVLFRYIKMANFNIKNPVWTSDAWGWGVSPQGLAVCRNNSDIVITSDCTQAYLTRDGGKSWETLACKTSGSVKTQEGGMPVMSAYNYYIDPHNYQNRYIAMNDFCNWFSYDGNKTWAQYNKGNPYPHNVYTMEIDPDKPGRIWAGSCKNHDLPHWKWLNKRRRLLDLGTVMVSDDYGKSWNIPSEDCGLPKGNVPGVALDPKSPVDSRHLWAAVWNKGFFASTDGGNTWVEKNNGISKYNKRAFKIKYDKFGRLWGITSLNGGALYLSKDRGENWKFAFRRRGVEIFTGITIDDKDENVVYASALVNYSAKKGGGIWKSVDGGKTWAPSLEGVSCWGVYIHPQNKDLLVACINDKGLLISRDAGKSWKEIEDFPAKVPIGVTFDPKNSETVYISCFGSSIWKGTIK